MDTQLTLDIRANPPRYGLYMDEVGDASLSQGGHAIQII